MFTQDYLLQSLFVKGEVSNCKYHSSGHIYFTLKDPKGTINCVMFAGNRSGLSFRLEQGQQVVVGGTVDVYERDGKYQLYAKEIILDGSGLLYEKFERLKRELMELCMIVPKQGAAPKLFLCEGKKGGAAGLKIVPNLVLYDDDGTESAQLRQIYGKEPVESE